MKNNNSCCCGSSCCSTPDSNDFNKKIIVIDFLYLDVTVCDRCQGTDNSLDEAISEVSKVLEATGVEVIVNKINVIDEELARKYKFVTSPTIRINGNDIQMDFKESLCESCGDLCGDNVDCRVWVHEGKEYTQPPKAMIIEAILKEVYGGGSENQEEHNYIIPKNLMKFYNAKKAKDIR
jgi:glutaredoxin